MNVINQFKLVNNDNSKGIKFHWASSVNDNITINNVSIPAAGQSSANNYAANFGGIKRLISVDFVLFDDGTDKTTDSSNKVILADQWDYLLDEVIEGFSTSQSAVNWTLTIYRNGATKTYTGVIEDITLNGNPGTAGNRIEGTLTLFRSA